MMAFCALLPALAAKAQDAPPVAVEEQRFVADIELQTSEQFVTLLERSEQLLLAGVSPPQEGTPVTFVLHGPVLKSLLRDNYLANKRLVDLAAALTALEVIDIKACNSWMAHQGVAPSELQPFVEPVAYGPGLVERLVTEQNYRYF